MGRISSDTHFVIDFKKQEKRTRGARFQNDLINLLHESLIKQCDEKKNYFLTVGLFMAHLTLVYGLTRPRPLFNPDKCNVSLL